MFTIERLTQQLNDYMKQHAETKLLVQQIAGAIQAVQHQITTLQKEAKEAAEAKRKEDEDNAIKEGNEPEDNLSEHQDGESSGETPESSGSDCIEQGAGEQKQEEQIA